MKAFWALLAAATGAVFSLGGCGNQDPAPPVASIVQELEGDPLQGTLAVVDDWGSGYRADVRLCNQGTVVTTSWTAVVTLNQSTFAGAYNATAAVSGSILTLTPHADFMAAIQPGQCQTLGFTALPTGTNYLPTFVGVCSRNAATDYCAPSGTGGAGGTGGTGGGGTGGTSGGTGGTGGAATGGGGTGGTTGGTGGTGGTVTGGTGATTGGTGGAGGEEHSDYRISIDLPYGLGWTDVTLHASRELRVDDYSRALKADQTRGPVVSMGDAETNMGVDSQVGDLWSVPHVLLRSRAEVYGTIRTGASDIEKQAEIDPFVIPVELTNYDFRPTSTVTWELEVPLATGPGPVLSPWQYQWTPLAPGAYSGTNLGANSTLRLSPGTFFFRNGLTIEPGAKLQVLNSNGPVVLVVVDTCVIHGQITRQADTPNVLLVYLGTADLTLETGFNGTVLAPYAKVLTGSYKQYKGALFGRDVEVQPNSRVTLQPFARSDCATADKGCGKLIGCLPVDTDHDGLSDCDEAGDGDTWTDPAIFNGSHVRLYPVCHLSGPANNLIDTTAEVAECTAVGAVQELDQYHGWNWTDPGSSSTCAPGYEFLPRFTSCLDDWLLVGTSSINVLSAGRVCLAMRGDTTSAAGVMFIDGASVARLGEGTGCRSVEAGEHMLRWVVERTGAPQLTQELSLCFGGASDCEPTEPLTQCALRPNMNAPPLPCTEESECSGECPCEPGAECDEARGCAGGLLCLPNLSEYYGRETGLAVCSAPCCVIDPAGCGCGYSGALCGENCTLNPACTTDADCPSGMTCGIGNGHLFGDEPGTSHCWKFGDEGGCECGSAHAPCGECLCVPQCDGKVCGDSTGNGCGGECPGICGPGETGCTMDINCPAGYGCMDGACRPFSTCLKRPLVPPDCGDDNAPCGPCPECPNACAGRQCGTDPDCGVECGECEADSYCAADGSCVVPTVEPPIFVPDGEGGTLPLDPLDPGPTSQEGALPGMFAVSDRGLATYTIPIQVPPGRAGMQPAVSLDYVGTRTDGLVGVGWQVGGRSSIERCQRIYALDGNTAPIEKTAADKFCLDGKRLVETSGEYGANGTEYRTLVDSLSRIVSYGGTAATGPESFKVWTKQGRLLEYTAVRDSTTAIRRWMLDTVRDRSDNTMRYLYRAFGDVRAVSSIMYTGHGSALGKREVRFEYEDKDTSPEKKALWRFTPAGDRFYTESRLSAVRTVVGGRVVRTYRLKYENGGNGTRRLQQATECEGDTDNCKDPTRFGYYEYELDDEDMQLEYEPRPPSGAWADLNGDGFADRLVSSVQLTPNKVPAETVYADWGITIAGAIVSVATEEPFIAMAANTCWDIAKELIWGGSSRKVSKEVYLGDGMRGDNSNRTRLTNFELGCPGADGAQIADLDGDGMDDVVERCSRGSDPFGAPKTVTVYWTRGTGSNDPVLLHIDDPQATVNSPPNTRDPFLWPRPPVAYANPEIIDLNGDGLPDLLYCLDHSKMAYRLNRPDPDGENMRFGDEVIIPGDEPNSLCTIREPYKLIFDVDGDGTPNLVRWNREEDGSGVDFDALVMTSEGLKWKPAFSGVGLADGQGPAVLGDFNGDQLMDIYQPNAKTWQTGEPLQVVYVNHGGYFVPEMLFSDEPAGELVAFTAFDMDHDGSDDVLAWSPTGERALVRRIDHEAGRTSVEGEDFPDRLWNNLADLDGDGSLDVIDDTGLGGNDGTMFVFYGAGRRTNMLETITDGEGNRIGVDYDKDETGTPVYTFDKDDCAWPRRCVKRAAPVVSRHTEGVAYNNSTYKTFKYRYHHGRMDYGGHGWLGFKSRQIEEYVAGSTEPRSRTIVEYEDPTPLTMDGAPADPATTRYFYPFAGLVKSRETHTPELWNGLMPAGEPHGRWTATETDWVLQRAYQGTLFPVVQLRRNEEYDLGGETCDSGGCPLLAVRSESYTVDSFGNVLLYRATGAPDTRIVDTTYDVTQAEIDEWLISNPDTQQITSERQGSSQTRFYQFTYLENGLPWTVTRAPGDAGYELTTTYTYDEFGNVREIQQRDRATGITYDQDDVFPALVTNALGQSTALGTDPRFGGLIASVDPNGIAEQWAYDGFGRSVRAKGPDGTWTTTLEETGLLGYAFQVKVVHEENGNETTYGINSRGLTRFVRTRGFGGAEVWEEYVYDALGRLTNQARPHLEDDQSQGSITYEYDTLDRLTRLINPDGSDRHYEYASTDSLAEGYYDAWVPGSAYPKEIVRTTDELDRQSVTLSDRYGNLVRTVDAANVTESVPNKTDLTYGPFNTVSTIRDNLGHTTGLWYDRYGRRTAVHDPDNGQRDYAYTAYDELRLTLDPTGAETTFTYDSLGRLTEREGSEGTSRWVYDGTGPNEIGRLIETIAPPSASNPDGHRVRYAYEPTTAANRGRLQSVTRQIDAAGPELTTRLEYDAAGQVQRMHYPAPDGVDVRVRYGYDGPYVTSVVDETGGTDRPLWNVVLAEQGYLLAAETLGATGARTEYAYESFTGQIRDAQTFSASGETLQRIQYTYLPNQAVNDRTLVRAGGSAQYENYFYDARNRVTTILTEDEFGQGMQEYRYDDIGNITQKAGIGAYTYSATRPHLAEAAGTHAYSYDPRGNLTSRSGPTVPGQQQTFLYTSFDLPSEITTGTASPVTTHLEYDADQTRVMKWTDTSRTYYAGDLYRRTVDESSGHTEHRYAVYVGSRQVAEMVREDGEALPSATYALLTDRLGSVMTASDGQNSYSRDFAAFGDIAPAQFSAGGVIAGFTGHNHDPELGLVDMKGRMYDPSAGRFLSADPVMDTTHSQGLNPYSYVWNNPLNLTDPSGFSVWSDDESLFMFMGVATAIVGIGIGVSVAGQVGGSVLPGLASGLGSVGYGAASDAAIGSSAGVSDAAIGSSAGASTSSDALLNDVAAPPGLLDGPDESLACTGPAKNLCMKLAMDAANSPAGQWAQRMAQRYGPQIANWARVNGARAATLASQWAQRAWNAARGGLTVAERATGELASKLTFTATTAKHMAEAGRYVPRHTLAEAIQSGTRMADPQGAQGAIKIVQELSVNGTQRTLEIIYREADNTILHFLYK